MRRFNGSVVLQFDDATTGNSGADIPVTVRFSSSKLKATLYSKDEAISANEIPNPVKSGLKGNYTFFVADGTYNVEINEGQGGSYSLLDEQIFDADGATDFRNEITVVSGTVDYTLPQNLTAENVVVIGGEILPPSSYSGIGTTTLKLSEPLYDTTLSFEVFDRLRIPSSLMTNNVRYHDTVANAQADAALTVGSGLITFFYNTDILCIWKIVAGGTGAGDMTDGTLNLANGLQAKLEITPGMSPKQFGAFADGIKDDAVYITNCDVNSKSWVIDTPYGCSKITITSNATCVDDGVFNWVGANVNPVPTFIDIKSETFGDLVVDAKTSEIQCFHVSGTGVQRGNRLVYSNITTSDLAKNVCAGVLVKNPEFHLNEAVCTGFINALSGGNDSSPQSFVVDSTSVVYLGSHIATDSNSGLVNAGGELHVQSNICSNMQDNGIYNLSGSRTYVDNMVYQSRVIGTGREEPIVNSATLEVNTLTLIGKCFSAIRAENATYTYVGVIIAKAPHGTAKADLWTNVPTGIYQHRSGNTASGECRIGRVEGTFYLSLIRTGFSSGTTAALTIGSGNVNLISRSLALDINWVKSNWWNFDGVKQLNNTNFIINILDVNDALTTSTGDYFNTVYPTFTEASTIENVDIYIKNAAGTKSTNGVYRGKAPQEQLKIRGGTWQTNAGPYQREMDYQGGVRESCTVVPSTSGFGYWRRGEMYSTADGGTGTAGAYFYRCTGSGIGAASTWSTLS